MKKRNDQDRALNWIEPEITIRNLHKTSWVELRKFSQKDFISFPVKGQKGGLMN